jgi:hypothetical protein
MKLREFIEATVIEYFNEGQIDRIINTGLSVGNKIEGGFLNKKEAEDLQKKIESNYDDFSSGTMKWNQDSNDIRKNIYSYESPIAEKDINGVNLRIAPGLIEGEPYSGKRRKTYLLYADGKIIGKFYSVEYIKNVIKYIEDRLVKSISPNIKELRHKR